MSNEQNDGFLGRWSRRKVQARAGQPVEAPSAPSAPAAPAARAESAGSESNRAPALAPPAQAAIENEAPVLTLEDVKALTVESDFRPFVAREVAPEVRNAAFKRLFADPHFNVMDGLDIYIDDYGKPDPLPASMLAQMASARFLKLIEDVDEPAAAAMQTTTQEPPSGEVSDAPADNPAPTALPAADAADARASIDDSPHMSREDGTALLAHDAQDPDLRLQPDDAARRPADRAGAE